MYITTDLVTQNSTHFLSYGARVSKVCPWHNWVLCSQSYKVNSKCQWAAFTSGLSWNSGSTSKLIQVVGRIQFLVAVGGSGDHTFLLDLGQLLLSATTGHSQVLAKWLPNNMAAYCSISFQSLWWILGTEVTAASHFPYDAM